MYRLVKRAFDFAASAFVFLLISPFFLVLMILVRINLGSPIFFKQIRSGKGQKSFTIVKFRTMTEEVGEDGNRLPDEERMTRLGQWLRSTSLDELPELLSIIKGDMSVIGPRPLPPHYDDYYTEREKKRFMVRSGLIPPEVLYNNVQPTWDEQLEYEATYAENISFFTDVRVILAVFKGLFSRYCSDYGEYVRQGLDQERTLKEVVKK